MTSDDSLIDPADLASTSYYGVFEFTRLIALFLPLLNLWLVFIQQSETGLVGRVLSMLHVFSNPIDAFWSIRYRQELVYHYYLFTVSQTPDVARELTAVMATYDLWLEDVRSHLKLALEARRQSDNWNSRGSCLLLEQEKHLIRYSALRLRSCRIDNTTHVGWSIMSYVGSSVLVAYRALHGRDEPIRTHASSIFALIAILSHLIFAVCINGRTGSFQYPEEAIRIVFELSIKLKKLSLYHAESISLLPTPSIPEDDTFSIPSSTGAANFSRRCTELGSASGVLNCIRPHKTSNVSKESSQSVTMLLIAPIYAVFVSFMCATTIDLIAIPSGSKITLLPLLGCLGLWICNWLISIAMSAMVSKSTVSTHTYALATLACDIVFGIILIMCFVLFLTSWEEVNHTGQPVEILKLAICLAITLLQAGGMLFLGSWTGSSGSVFRHVFAWSTDEALAIDEAIDVATR